MVMPDIALSDIDWRRAFVRSGVRFVDRGDVLDLSNETPANIEFVRLVVGCVGSEAQLTASAFSVPTTLVNESEGSITRRSLYHRQDVEPPQDVGRVVEQNAFEPLERSLAG